jgi:hypothetical protein
MPPASERESASPGVRKMLDAFEERDLSRIRWSAVFGGLFLAFGVEVLLGMLGFAAVITADRSADVGVMNRMLVGMAIWLAIASLAALFIGGYASARLGGSIRRGDGALAGALTWSVSLGLAIVVLGTGAPFLFGVAVGVVREGAEGMSMDFTWSRADMLWAVWASFFGAIVSLFAAVVGGALGAVGRRRGVSLAAPPPRADEQIPLY